MSNVKPTKVKIIKVPPFPELTCKDNEWECSVVFPAWAGFQSRGGHYGSIDSLDKSSGKVNLTISAASEEQSAPLAEQIAAYEFQLKNGSEVVKSVLNALEKYYSDLRADWCKFIKPEDLNDVMPEIKSHKDFESLIGISEAIIHASQADGLAHIGIIFGCTWDEEYSLGLLLHGSTVIEIGIAQCACQGV